MIRQNPGQKDLRQRNPGQKDPGQRNPGQRNPGQRNPGRAPAAALVAACVVMLAASCSSHAATQAAATPVASLPGHAAGARSAKPLTGEQSDQDMISFARCMRGHGVQMPDPFHRSGHSGLTIDMPTRDGATSHAYGACMHFIESIVQAKQAGAAAQAAPHLAALTRYARCMRRHDIAMLDPTPEGDLSLGTVPGLTSDFGRYSPQFRAADAACRHVLPAGVRDNGTGP